MAGVKGNSGGKKGRSGRAGYNHQIVIEQAYKIVQAGLRGELTTVTEQEQFRAAVELVKKALPTNIDFGEKTLQLLFDNAFAQQTKTNSPESGKG